MQAQILELLENLRRDLGLSMILITHDLSVLAETCDRVAIMYGGQIAESGPVGDLYSEPAAPLHAAAAGRIPGGGGPARAGPGRSPASRPTRPCPDGCRFSPRCHQAQDRCHRELVQERPLNGGSRTVRCLFAPWPGSAP